MERRGLEMGQSDLGWLAHLDQRQLVFIDLGFDPDGLESRDTVQPLSGLYGSALHDVLFDDVTGDGGDYRDLLKRLSGRGNLIDLPVADVPQVKTLAARFYQVVGAIRCACLLRHLLTF